MRAASTAYQLDTRQLRRWFWALCTRRRRNARAPLGEWEKFRFSRKREQERQKVQIYSLVVAHEWDCAAGTNVLCG
jgi:hypothetical protein